MIDDKDKTIDCFGHYFFDHGYYNNISGYINDMILFRTWQPIKNCNHKNNIIGVIFKKGVRGEVFECKYIDNGFQSITQTDLSPHKPTHYIDIPKFDDNPHLKRKDYHDR